MAGRIVCLGLFLLGTFSAAPLEATWLFQRDGTLYTESGTPVRLTGINWFGFETSNCAPHGLWARDYRGVIRQIADMGFNTLRVPWSNRILDNDAEAQSINYWGDDPYLSSGDNRMNTDLEGKSPLEILDAVIAACTEEGLKVILDNHSREPDGYMNEKLWYTDNVSHEEWISDWRFLADRYAGNKTVIGADLNNEPHGKSGIYAEWGSGNPATDWHAAAQECGNAVLEVNPDILIIVEGVEKVGAYLYWWGGNLVGVNAYPVELTNPEKLVYSPHEYGPEVFSQSWFEDPRFPDNLPALWDHRFGFIANEGIGHLLVGEFGIKDPESFGGKTGIWFDTFMAYMGETISWTFWCINPNSGDTEGILDNDWITVKQWKLDKLVPYMAPGIEDAGSPAATTPRFNRNSAFSTGNTVRTFTLSGRRSSPLSATGIHVHIGHTPQPVHRIHTKGASHGTTRP